MQLTQGSRLSIPHCYYNKGDVTMAHGVCALKSSSFFIDTTEKLLPAALLMQKWVHFSIKNGCGPKISHALCVQFYLVHSHTRTTSYTTVRERPEKLQNIEKFITIQFFNLWYLERICKGPYYTCMQYKIFQVLYVMSCKHRGYSIIHTCTNLYVTSHTLQSQEKEGLVTTSTVSCYHETTTNLAWPATDPMYNIASSLGDH